MASMTTTHPSPTSLQLRFSRRCRLSPSVSVRPRFPAPRRRNRPIHAAQSPTSDGARGGSWSGSDSGNDPFAGWSGGGGGDPQKKGGLEGILGVGLAGFFFTTGIAFASLSLINRTPSGTKKQMESLTGKQEVLLTSDDHNMEGEQVANESDAVLPDKVSKIEYSPNSKTDIDMDPFSPIQSNENAEGEFDSINHLETSVHNIETVNAADPINRASDEVDTQIALEDNNIPAPSNFNPNLSEFSSSDDIGFATDVSSYKPSEITTDSGVLNSVIEQDVNTGTVDIVNTPTFDTDSVDYTADHQEISSSPKETVDFEEPLEFSSEPEGPILTETIILEPSNYVDSDTKDLLEPTASTSEEQDIEHSSGVQHPVDSSTSRQVIPEIDVVVPSDIISRSDADKIEPLKLSSETSELAESHTSNESATSVTYSISESSDWNEKKLDIGSTSQIDRSLPFKSALPERNFSFAGIPAPSLISAALQVPPGKVLVPAVVDQVQGQTLAALQVLKVIETNVQPGDLCTRREYARWLVSASSVLSRNTVSKVYPAMYIENMTELAFEDVTPEDPDFSYIQGLAEAGIISSKLSSSDLNGSSGNLHEAFLFSPESPASRQDLVSWKMALEKRLLPEVDKNVLYQRSGYIDIDKISPDAWPALVADLFSAEQSITALAFGHTRLFQPNKPVTKAQAAIALAIGDAAEVVEEELARIEAESLAESAVNAHTALVAQVEKDLNTNFKKELAKEKEKINTVEKLAEEARVELERFREEREAENYALLKGRAALESEMEVLSRLRHEVEEQLQEIMSKKVDISFERDRINKIRQEAENENQAIVQLQYELEVERKALSMARAWAEEEAKRAREQARVLEDARAQWERRGIKVVVDTDLKEDASTGVTWLTAEQEPPIVGTINRAETLVEKLRAMADEIKVKSSNVIEILIQKITALISALKHWAYEASDHARELRSALSSAASRSLQGFQENASGFGVKASRSVEEIRENASRFSSSVGEKATKALEDCKGSVDKIAQKFKT